MTGDDDEHDEFETVSRGALERVHTQLVQINERLDGIERTLQDLGTSARGVSGSCARMDGHIDFVESCFAPLSILSRRISLALPQRRLR